MSDAPLLHPDAESQLLTETIWETLQHDLLEVKSKVMIVVNPKADTEHALRDWDLWGPLILCLFLTVVLSITAPSGQTTLLFTGVFSIITFGSAIVAINLILLGTSVSFFQAICVLGYCLFPIALTAFVSAILRWLIVRIVTVPIGLSWSLYSVSRFFGKQIPENRKILGLYPCALLYAILSWIVFIS